MQKVLGRSPALPTLEEATNPVDSADHQTTDESQKATPGQVKLHPAKLRGKHPVPGSLPTLFATQPPPEEAPGSPDSVHREAVQSEQATPKEVKSHLAKMQGKHRVRSRLWTLFAKQLPLVEASASPDSEYQSADGRQQATQEKMKSYLSKLKGKHHDPGRLPTLLATQPPLVEDPDRPDSAYQTEDELQTTSDEGKSEERSDKEQRSPRNKREHPLPKDSPKVSRRVGRSTWRGTSTTPHIDTRVRPVVMKSSGIRWNVAHLHKSKDDNTRYKKKKKKKPHDPTASGSAIIVAGIAAGILVLLCVVGGLMQLCKKCRRRSRKADDPEHGLAKPGTKKGGESGRDEETVFERKAAKQKKQASKKKSKGKSKPSATSPPEQPNNYTGHASTTYTETSEDTCSVPVSRTAGHPVDEVWIVNETSGSASSPASQSPISEPSTWTPNETPPSTPGNAASRSSSASWTSTKTAKLSSKPRLSTTTASAETATNADETASEHFEARDTTVASPTQSEGRNTTSTQSSGLAKNSGESVASSNTNESNASNSSTESCKTPVAPLNEVIITMEDDEEMKLVLVSSSECSSGELLYTSGNSGNQGTMDVNGNMPGHENGNKSLIGSEYESSSGEIIYTSEPTKTDATTDAAEVVTSSMKSSADEPPLPPPPMTPLRASTKLKLGKAVGGRKAKENRLSIKHLSSGHYSSGFLGDLKMAVSKMLTKDERFVDKNKEKRKVIKEQTKETGRSMKESIVLGKAIIMNENADNIRDQRCASRRRVIRKALSPPPDSTLRPHSSMSQEIAFAQSVILPGSFDKKAMRKIKERCKVMKELVNDVKGSSFEHRLQIVASTINPDEEIRDANAKGHHKRSVIMMDSEMMKLGGKKSTFRSDIQFVRNVICGPPAIDHEKQLQMGCLCYHCKKHWAKTGGPPCFKSPRAITISKDIVLIDGKLFFVKPKAAHASSHSKTPSNSYSQSNPSTTFQGPTSGSNGN